MKEKTKILKIKIPRDFYYWLQIEMNMHRENYLYTYGPNELKGVEQYIVDRFISCCRQSSHRNKDSVYVTASEACRQSRMTRPEMKYFQCKCCKDVEKFNSDCKYVGPKEDQLNQSK